MPDIRFYTKKPHIGLDELKNIVKCDFANIVGQGQTIHDVATLDSATQTDLSFYHNSKYLESLRATKAGIVLCKQQDVAEVPSSCSAVVVQNPYRAYAEFADYLYSHTQQDTLNQYNSKNFCHDSAKIGQNVTIEPGAVIMAHAVIGDDCYIGAHSIIRRGVTIGAHTFIDAHCVISHSLIGQNVKIYPGTKIGQAGFGFVMDDQGYLNVPQLGRVIIEDNVEIGANTTIDRGTLDDTIIGQGTRIDNLVQIGHGVKIGQHCVIVALVGISGSTEIGHHVIAAGQVGIAGHLKIGNHVVMAAKSGILRNIADHQVVGGIPAVPIKQWHRQSATLAKLAQRTK